MGSGHSGHGWWSPQGWTQGSTLPKGLGYQCPWGMVTQALVMQCRASSQVPEHLSSTSYTTVLAQVSVL